MNTKGLSAFTVAERARCAAIAEQEGCNCGQLGTALPDPERGAIFWDDYPDGTVKNPRPDLQVIRSWPSRSEWGKFTCHLLKHHPQCPHAIAAVIEAGE